jgi:hypothetical protein
VTSIHFENGTLRNDASLSLSLSLSFALSFFFVHNAFFVLLDGVEDGDEDEDEDEDGDKNEDEGEDDVASCSAVSTMCMLLPYVHSLQCSLFCQAGVS